MDSISTVFVYGTLMHGQANYRSFAAGSSWRFPAWLWGCLYDTGAGYPMLEIPAEHGLLPSQLAHKDAESAASLQMPASQGFYPVWGELMCFDDLAQRLPRLDALEDYRPGSPSLYDRVITKVMAFDGTAQLRPMFAWCYVRGALAPDSFLQRPIVRWPAVSE